MNLFGNIFPYGKFGSSRAINGENPTGEKVKEEWHREAWAKAEKVIHALLILHQAVLQFWQIYMGVG